MTVRPDLIALQVVSSFSTSGGYGLGSGRDEARSSACDFSWEARSTSAAASRGFEVELANLSSAAAWRVRYNIPGTMERFPRVEMSGCGAP